MDENTFAREYFAQYRRAGQMALVLYGTKQAVETKVQHLVNSLDAACDLEDRNVVFLALAHFLECHTMLARR